MRDGPKLQEEMEARMARECASDDVHVSGGETNQCRVATSG